ncbi:MAG: ABC-F family ATP-binding cassette domain-containing protein [Oligoflexus sp.]
MIQIQELTKRFGDKVLFDLINYQFPTGERIALVGANGAGKTTLLNIICHLEEADSGQIIIPQNVSLGYLPQEPNPKPEPTVLQECLAGAKELFALRKKLEQLTSRMANDHDPKLVSQYEESEAKFRIQGGYAIEAKAHTILEGLGFSQEKLTQAPTELSGGWRMRLELAKLFLSPIDFLILDEPTNHLDLPTLVWVENFLNQFRGTLLFVSHDRALLNRLSTQTLHLFGGKLTAYPCAFDQFLEAREMEREQDQARLDNLGKKREHLQQFVDRFGAKATKAKQAQSKAKLIAKLRALEDNIQIDQDAEQVAIKLPSPPKSARLVAEMKDLAIGYDTPLFRKLDLTIERGQRIAVIGANGIGKSTLLKTLASQIKALAGEAKLGANVSLAYYSQNPEDSLTMEQDVLSQLLQCSDKIGAPAARSLLGAFLFHGDDVFKKVEVLSGGEKSRVALAKLLIQEANFLLMDEPTNHLDMASVEALSDALCQYEGTVLFVSHDRNFINAVCTHVFVMLADGRSMLFSGQLEDYERLAKLQNFPNLLSFDQVQGYDANSQSEGTSNNQNSSQSQHQEARQLKSRRQSLQKQIIKLEQLQEETGRAIAQLEVKMSEIAADDYQKAYTIQSQVDELQTKLSSAEDEWMSCSHELEEVEEALAQMGRLN